MRGNGPDPGPGRGLLARGWAMLAATLGMGILLGLGSAVGNPLVGAAGLLALSIAFPIVVVTTRRVGFAILVVTLAVVLALAMILPADAQLLLVAIALVSLLLAWIGFEDL